MRSIWITVKKELRSIFRDRKTFAMLLFFPLLIPMMIFLYASMYEDQSQEEMYLVGINYELNQNEASFMDEAHLKGEYYATKKEMERAYQQGKILGYIDYQEKEHQYLVYTNEDSEEGMYVSSYVSAYLDSYNQYLAKLSLIGEDVDVEKAYDNLSYEVVDLEGENWMLMLMFTIAFTYIVMAIVIATTNMATTATAVEKENGTLETILTFPVSSRDLVLGKYLATVFMGFLSSFIGLILTVASLRIAVDHFSVFQEVHYSIGGVEILVAVVVVALASFFIGGLSIMLTSFTKSYKEAQSVSSVLNILTVIPMMISLVGLEVSRWYYLLPIFNYTQVLMDIFSGGIDWWTILIVIGSSVFYVIVVIFYIVKQYRSERVLFGN